MARPKSLVKRKEVSISLDVELVAYYDNLYKDPISGKRKLGAFSALIEDMLRARRKEVQEAIKAIEGEKV